MSRFLIVVFALFLIVPTIVLSQPLNQVPKYGRDAKHQIHEASDEAFLKSVGELYEGDFKKAANDLADRGWQFLREGNLQQAMARFNQSWMADKSNGKAIWGMAVVCIQRGELDKAIELFNEAKQTLADDIDFLAEYARALSVVGIENKDAEMLTKAFERFNLLYQKVPEHTLNLQNWAIALTMVGSFKEAWEKIIIAEATPRSNYLDQQFIRFLESQMPRPE